MTIQICWIILAACPSGRRRAWWQKSGFPLVGKEDADRLLARDYRENSCVAFLHQERVGVLILRFSKLNSPAHRLPLSTLQATSRDVPCKTEGQDGVAVSLLVGLFHSLQHAGLARRTRINAIRAGRSEQHFRQRDWTTFSTEVNAEGTPKVASFSSILRIRP